MKADPAQPGPVPAVIVPELFRTTGGVQVFSRRMIAALDSLMGRPVPVISRNDRREDCPAAFLEGRQFSGMGDAPAAARRLLIAGACFSSRAPFFISTHPHFAPLLRLISRWKKKPFLSVAHGIDVWNIAGSKVAWGLEAAECVLPVSRYTEERLRGQIGAASPSMEWFPNTFDKDRFHPGPSAINWRERLGIPADAAIMLSVCRLSRSEFAKGYDKVLEEMPALAARYPGLHWVLAGKGDDQERIAAKAKELGVLERCRFTGFVPDDDLPDLYRSADLFVLPSQKEGFGIVFLEAAACGLPVIAGNRDGSVDALANGELGTLIDPESPEQLASAIRSAIESPKPDARRLHEKCVDWFGPEAFKQRLGQILSHYPRSLAQR
ncbi:glycosyltransferase [Luteolibacter luteus]|uniref:Glycosyltransferase family 4 protein n=1 Tax=Luteolibacter luteus TaxID=2728835 RepID=A0A858RC47_9BACT|nr:glycosyltransferase [Luteolibacter luteus]QJE94292.1 glycosyltransferase family 4 protein [Luteolibacter luteus]